MNSPEHIFAIPDFHTEVFDTAKKRAWAAEQPDAVRHTMIQNLLFEYDQFQNVTDELRCFHMSKGIANKGRIFGVIGEFRTGKSYIVQRYVRPYQFKMTPEGFEYPALYLEGSSDWDASGFPRAVIKATGGGVRGKTPADIRDAAINRIIDHKVDTLFVEDMQLFSHKPKALEGFFGFVHLVLSRHLCSIFVITSSIGEAAIRQNTQIKERGGFEVVPVKGFNPKGARGRNGLRLFLNGVDLGLPFRKPSNLGAPQFARTFMELKMDTVPRVMNVIRSAACRAFEDDLDLVPESYIEAAIRRQLSSNEQFSGIGSEGSAETNSQNEDGMYA